MPKIVEQGRKPWANYHGSINISSVDLLSYEPEPGDPTDVTAWLRASELAIRQLLADAKTQNRQLSTVGASWSFTPLIGSQDWLLETEQQAAVFDVPAAQRVGLKHANLVIVGGGTRLALLNRELEARGYSLRTSGSYSGQSIAGAIATGVHGGVMSAGGMQNHVRAMHLVISPDRSIWLEAASEPVLDDAFALSFATEILRDDDVLEAARVHLGGMGYVNAVLLEVAPLFLCNSHHALRLIDRDWLATMASKDFAAIARAQGIADDPYFYELTLDPFDPFAKPAMHTIYTCSDAAAAMALPMDAGKAAQIETLDLIGAALAAAMGPAGLDGKAASPPQDIDVPEMVRQDFAHVPDVRQASWGAMHGAHVRQYPLYNAAFAIELARLPEAMDIMCATVRDMLRHFVFTVRIVHNSDGTLAFSRFPDTAVVNLDGAGASVSPVCPLAAAAIFDALDHHGIDFSLHWGKLGGITSGKVDRDFGPVGAPGSKLARWRRARDLLVPQDMREVLTNDALKQWGLA
ncbi:MAG TPA: FAD-binding protein [Sphingomonadaceae bacterium]|nr:FAD-binding protein [Sphingomonadaceae bacterium]